MNITREQIIARTLCCMEELPPEAAATVVQNEGVSIDRYIDGKIGETLRLLALSAPAAELWTCRHPAPPAPEKRQDGSGRITLDEGILRPVSLLMEGWHRPVTQFIDEASPLYELQFNPYTRGGCAKPVAVWTTDGEGHRVIDYYSLPVSLKAHRIAHFYYLAYPEEDAASYTLSVMAADALCYRCAAAVYDLMGNHQLAEVMRSHALW